MHDFDAGGSTLGPYEHHALGARQGLDPVAGPASQQGAGRAPFVKNGVPWQAAPTAVMLNGTSDDPRGPA